MEYGIGWKGSCSNGEYEVVELYLGKNNGNIYDLYKTKARTSCGGLTYPFDNKYRQIRLRSFQRLFCH